MRQRLILFAADVIRYGPLAAVSLATLICLPSLLSYLSGDLRAVSVLERYALALLLSLVAVRLLSRLILRYAARNVVALAPSESEDTSDETTR